MKTTTFLLLFIWSTSAYSQCEATVLDPNSPATADNSGNQINFAALFDNEYIVLNGLIIGDTYTVDSDDLFTPIVEPFLTLRDTNDNSVLLSDNTPFTFTATTESVEVHCFPDNSCTSSVLDLQIVSLVNESTLSIPNNTIKKFSVYPNPVSNYLNVSSDSLIVEVLVFDITGKQVFGQFDRVKELSIDLSNMKQGVYFLNIISDDKTKEVVKIIKQ